MKSTLPATHLLGHFVVFTLAVLFISTMARAAYVLWQFVPVQENNALVMVFVQGLRHDLAYAGLVCLIPAVLGFLLAMFGSGRLLARWLVVAFFTIGIVVLLLTELVTPWFLESVGERPTVESLQAVDNPVEVVTQLAETQPLPVAVGVILVLLIIIAFIGRLEISRLLRYRLSWPSALFLLLVTTVLCMLAVHSSIDMQTPALAYRDSAFNEETGTVVQELALNSAGKLIYHHFQPVLEPLL